MYLMMCSSGACVHVCRLVCVCVCLHVGKCVCVCLDTNVVKQCTVEMVTTKVLLYCRIDVANTIAGSSNVTMGDVLVYNVVPQTINGTACLTATLRMTGLDGEEGGMAWGRKRETVQHDTSVFIFLPTPTPGTAADANAMAVMQAVMQGSLGAYSTGTCEWLEHVMIMMQRH